VKEQQVKGGESCNGADTLYVGANRGYAQSEVSGEKDKCSCPKKTQVFKKVTT